MAHRHDLRVRYAECDMQRVVFNSHYLAWVDDAMSGWLRAVGWAYPDRSWDFMVRHAELEWHGGATFGDVVEIGCEVERWGTTSFVVRYEVCVADRLLVEARLTYVGVDPATGSKAEVPTSFRRALGGAGV